MKYILFILLTFVSMAQTQNPAHSLPSLEQITKDNVHSLEKLHVFGRGTITTLDWTPDLSQIAVGGSAGVWIYQADDLLAEPVWLTQHSIYISSVVYHPDEEILFVAGNDSRLRVFDAVNYTEIADYCFPAYINEYSPKCSQIKGIDVSRNGTLLAIALNDHIVIWDIEMQQILYRLFDDNVYHVAFAIDDTMLVSTSKGWDNTVRFWDLANLSETELNQKSMTLETNLPYGIWDMQLSTDSNVVIVAGFDVTDTGIAAIDVSTQDIIEIQPNIGNAVSFVSDKLAAGAVLSFNDGNTARYSVVLVDLMTGERQATIETGSTSAADIVVSPDGKQIAIGTLNGELYVYDLYSDQVNSTGTGLGYYMWDIAFSNDGQSIAIISGNQVLAPTLAGGGAGGGDRIYLLDLDNGRYQRSIERTNQLRQMTTIVAGQDKSFIVSGDEMYGISMWMPEEELRTLLTLPTNYSRVFDFELSADKQTGAMTLGGSTGRAVGILTIENNNISMDYYDTEVNNEQFFRYDAVAIHPDGSLFGASASDEQVYIWRTGISEPLRLNVEFSSVSDIAFSPNGELLAVNGYDAHGWDSVMLFDTVTFAAQSILKHESIALEHLIFNPESDLLIASSIQGNLILWPVQDNGAPVVFDAHSTNINSLAINPQGTLIATASNDGTVQIWGVPTR